jgi:hypothetical protein
MQQAALAQQQQMFQEAQGALKPYYTAGQNVLPTLQGLLTPGSSAASLAQMPGFQFNSQYGNLQATNALAAAGKASGGSLATAISQYNQGLAGNTWQNTVNALQGFANMGEGAAGAFGNVAVGAGNGMASTYGNIGNAQAAGTLGSANALSGGLTGATGSIANSLLLSKLLGSGASTGLYSTGSIGGTGGGMGGLF